MLRQTCLLFKLTKPSEKNYSTHKLEFLALYWAVTKTFHHYLYGSPMFEVMTDHNPLTYVQHSVKLDAHGMISMITNMLFQIA